MRRADRLFQIVQLLRKRKVTTAARLAEELEVSERTIYRDINDLLCSGLHIQGEAGVGYSLKKGFDLPPLMFSTDEIEALVLGARTVCGWGDPGLVSAAKSALTKIEAVLPDSLKPKVEKTALFALNFGSDQEIGEFLELLRLTIREKRKIHFCYVRADGQQSERTVRPLCLAFSPPKWMLTGWCELRDAFRNFRLDRMSELRPLDEVIVDEQGKGLDDFLRIVGGRG